jgi:hypothetical protein
MLTEIYVESDIYKSADIQEVTDLDAQINYRLPKGYDEFITTYGSGTISDFFHILSPHGILEITESWNDTLICDFWQYTSDFTFNIQKESYILGYTIDSDLFVFHPNIEGIYCLPRHDDHIYFTGKTFYETLFWIKNSGVLVEKSSILSFRPTGETSLLRYKIDRSYNFNEFLVALNVLGQPDKILNEHQCYKLFYRQWGLCIEYLPMYNDLMTTVDKKHLIIVYEIINNILTSLGFIITEKHNV